MTPRCKVFVAIMTLPALYVVVVEPVRPIPQIISVGRAPHDPLQPPSSTLDMD